MEKLLDTLPMVPKMFALPGLLDEGLTISVAGEAGVLLDSSVEMDNGERGVLWATARRAGEIFQDPISQVEVRLTVAARARLAWNFRDYRGGFSDIASLNDASEGRDMTPTQVDRFARLIMRLLDRYIPDAPALVE